MLRFLKTFWDSWLRFSRRVGDVIARVELTVLYYTLLAPFGLGVRVFMDPLALRFRLASSYWLPRSDSIVTLTEANRQ